MTIKKFQDITSVGQFCDSWEEYQKEIQHWTQCVSCEDWVHEDDLVECEAYDCFERYVCKGCVADTYYGLVACSDDCADKVVQSMRLQIRNLKRDLGEREAA